MPVVLAARTQLIGDLRYSLYSIYICIYTCMAVCMTLLCYRMVEPVQTAVDLLIGPLVLL